MHIFNYFCGNNFIEHLNFSGGGIGGINWPSDNLIGKGRVFNCRLLIKPSCEYAD